MKIIAVYNIKGGVGKTSTSANLAYLAAKDGCQTLLCDLDPQGSASYYFRIKPSRKFSSKKLLKGGKNIDKNIKGSDFENLDLLPSAMSYRNLDIALDDMKKSKKILSQILEPLRDEYEIILLDCPPNVTLLSENIFLAADHILVPVIPTTLSILTYEKLTFFFDENKYKRQKLLSFFSMVERRKKMHREVIAASPGKLENLLKTEIPYAAIIEKMGVRREPVASFSPRCAATRRYEELWNEIKTECSL